MNYSLVVQVFVRSLQVHGLIAAIFAQMDVLDYMSSRFMSEVHQDFMERLEVGEHDRLSQCPNLLAAWAAELLSVFFSIWLILRWLVAGARPKRRLLHAAWDIPLPCPTP